MTAQVAIDTGTATHVLAVPMAAVLYRPPSRAEGGAGAAPAGGASLVQSGPASRAADPVAGAPGSTVTVWVLNAGPPPRCAS